MEENRAANQRSAFSPSFVLALYISNGFGRRAKEAFETAKEIQIVEIKSPNNVLKVVLIYLVATKVTCKSSHFPIKCVPTAGRKSLEKKPRASSVVMQMRFLTNLISKQISLHHPQILLSLPQ